MTYMHLYETIADDIARSILRGQLTPGTRIPSVRHYAGQYDVSVNSVKTAYRLLEDRGLISARPQSGYYVRDSLPELCHLQESSVNSRESAVPLSGLNRLLSVILENQLRGDCTDLALACPSGDRFYPAGRLKKITAQLLRSASGFSTTYAMPPGSPRLRSQIARRGLHTGMILSPDDVIITHGTMEAISLAVRASTLPGDTVAVESPTFYNLYPMLEDLGRRIVNLPTHPQSGMCLDTLESLAEQRKISAVITIPSGHNPLGFVMPSENRQRLARMAETRQFAVIEDVIYAELQFGDTCIPNIRAFDRDGWVMVCASYTKTVAPDFRIGWLEAGRFRDVARQMKFTSTVAESGLLSESLGIFLENGGYDLHLRHLRRLYERQIDAVRACIADYFPAGTRVSRPQAGFILWIELPEGADTLALFHAALDEKILCMPGLLCSGSRAFNHCFRMAACFELTDRHRMAISRLGALAAHQLNEMK
ncbi:aminotransferase-like domain-containing protein [Pantoea eucalypti]|uniref:aminotransferase-like domain-containing protein n=2 Tax=Pantoea TaxID=53335 RepID=UPI0028A092D4|nr:PLP-dependent aminotransferase family protein [Pantoea eucalypti]